MSLAEQLLSKLQSGQVRKTFPAPSIAPEGKPALRMPPDSPWLGALAIETARVQVPPPLVDMNADMPPSKSAKGTMTLPFGCTTGLPPIPKSPPCVPCGALHVRPPSMEVLMNSTSPRSG